MNNPLQKEDTESPEALRDRLGREERRRRRLERSRATALRDGEDAPALSPADLRALKAADAVEARAVKGQRGAPGIRAQASRMRSAVGDALIARADARRADLRLSETVALDAAREGMPADQVVEVKRGSKQKRLRTRDGLKLMHESGALARDADGAALTGMAARIEGDRLLAMGLRFRDRYEIAQASLRSCLATPDSPPPSPTLWSQCRAAQRRAALGGQVKVLEMAVASKLGEEGLLVLRMVAGEARTVNSITPSARRRDRLTKALPEALRIVADMIDRGR